MKGDPVSLRKPRMDWIVGATSEWNAAADGGSERARTAIEWTEVTLIAAAEAEEEARRAARRFCIAGRSWDLMLLLSEEERSSLPREMEEMEVEGRKGRRLEETQEGAAEGSVAREGMSELGAPMTAEIWVPERARRMVGSEL